MAQASKKESVSNRPGINEGQMKGDSAPEKFANPMADKGGFSTDIVGMDQTSRNSGGEMVGFVTTGYIDKQGTPYGEAAKFNFLPPGMDISNQENAEIHAMPLKKLVEESYPGDGWTPTPRDVTE